MLGAFYILAPGAWWIIVSEGSSLVPPFSGHGQGVPTSTDLGQSRVDLVTDFEALHPLANLGDNTRGIVPDLIWESCTKLSARFGEQIGRLLTVP